MGGSYLIGGARSSPRHARAGELVPPAVNTDLGGVGLHQNGVPRDVFADAVWARYLAGALEIGHQSSEIGRRARRARRDVCEPLPAPGDRPARSRASRPIDGASGARSGSGVSPTGPRRAARSRGAAARDVGVGARRRVSGAGVNIPAGIFAPGSEGRPRREPEGRAAVARRATEPPQGPTAKPGRPECAGPDLACRRRLLQRRGRAGQRAGGGGRGGRAGACAGELVEGEEEAKFYRTLFPVP